MAEIKSKFSEQVPVSIQERGVAVRKVDNLHILDKLARSEPLVITMTLCPLYTGSLHEGRLVTGADSPREALGKSRVVAKWEQGLKAVEGILDAARLWRPNGDIALRLTFADAAVILGNPQPGDCDALDYHFQVYQDLAQEQFGSRAAVELGRYSTIHPDYPRLVTAQQDAVRSRQKSVVWRKRADEIADQINRVEVLLTQHDISFHATARGRKVMTSLLNLLGEEATIQLALQYGTFDARTTLPNSLNIFVERETMGGLLNLTDLFPHSANPRLDILC